MMTAFEEICFWLMAAMPWIMLVHRPRTTDKQAVLVVFAMVCWCMGY